MSPNQSRTHILFKYTMNISQNEPYEANQFFILLFQKTYAFVSEWNVKQRNITTIFFEKINKTDKLLGRQKFFKSVIKLQKDMEKP